MGSRYDADRIELGPIASDRIVSRRSACRHLRLIGWTPVESGRDDRYPARLVSVDRFGSLSRLPDRDTGIPGNQSMVASLVRVAPDHDSRDEGGDLLHYRRPPSGPPRGRMLHHGALEHVSQAKVPRNEHRFDHHSPGEFALPGHPIDEGDRNLLIPGVLLDGTMSVVSIWKQ